MKINELIELTKKQKPDQKGFIQRQKKREEKYNKTKKEINFDFKYNIK